MSDRVVIRAAEAPDLEELGQMAGELPCVLHHALDGAPVSARRRRRARVYARFFASQLAEPSVAILVAEENGQRVGYAHARLEPRDWNALLDAHGALHDIYVAPTARKHGVASALLSEAVKRLTALGAPRVPLSTATQNEAAQKLFAKHGFRGTMLEMTRELG